MSAQKNSEKYFLPENYIERDIKSTMAEVSGVDYWNKRRVSHSSMHQYHVYKYAAEIIREKNIKSLIDVGCGPASKLVSINKENPNLSIKGVDQNDAITYCQKTHGFGQWFVDDFENPNQELPIGKADLVISSDVIEHVLDPDKLLDYCKSKLNDGGYMLLSTPDRHRLHSPQNLSPTNKDHVREWSLDEFAKYIESRHYDILNHCHHIGIKPGINKLYARVLFNHFLRGAPKSLFYNQTILLQAQS
jgi:SAM-dependent methyltransferase